MERTSAMIDELATTVPRASPEANRCAEAVARSPLGPINGDAAAATDW